MNAARALQPEICSAASGGQAQGSVGRLQLWWLTRSREVAKGNAQVRCFLFVVRRSFGEPRTGVRGCCGLAVCLTRSREGRSGATGDLNHEWTRMDTNECSWGFQARDRSCCARWTSPRRCGSPAVVVAHAKPRSREGKLASWVFFVCCLAFVWRAADGSPRVLRPGCLSHAKP